MQFYIEQAAEKFYATQRNVPLMTGVILGMMILLPVGLHTDFGVFTTRIDLLLSCFPTNLVD